MTGALNRGPPKSPYEFCKLRLLLVYMLWSTIQGIYFGLLLCASNTYYYYVIAPKNPYEAHPHDDLVHADDDLPDDAIYLSIDLSIYLFIYLYYLSLSLSLYLYIFISSYVYIYIYTYALYIYTYMKNYVYIYI